MPGHVLTIFLCIGLFIGEGAAGIRAVPALIVGQGMMHDDLDFKDVLLCALATGCWMDPLY